MTAGKTKQFNKFWQNKNVAYEEGYRNKLIKNKKQHIRILGTSCLKTTSFDAGLSKQ